MREERITDSWVDQTNVIGRDEDKKTLVTKLISEEGSVTCGSRSDKVPTIFILGMGGLGKTTLAKSVFNDERVKEKFGDKRMWVCVGEVFDGEVIMKTMIESWGESVKPSPREQLAEMLKDRLYLLILDDVWNEDYLKWEPLQEILNQGARGSKIVITARNTGVVTKIGSAYTHELKGLGYDDCLSIFKKIVVEQGKEEEYEPLMDIGGEIVRKCGGLPLAVKTVASAVKGREPTKEQWYNILNNKIIWDLSQSKAGILPALMLSYTELPPQLKNCFAYCSIFEKDTLLKKDELIRLWVSQGCIVVNDGRRDEEEVGKECFEELLARSMFQEPKRDDDGNIMTCKMHDLIHDLAQWVTKEERRIKGNDDESNNNNALSQLAGARHCVVRKEVLLSGINLAGVENLRTLILTRYGSTPEPIDTVLKSLKSVRVLKLRNCSVRRHSWKHLGKLVHLRHLELSRTTFKQLPAATIGKLKELRYLDLSDTCIKTLPKNIGTLSSLRELNVEDCCSLVNLPKTIVSLPHLQVMNMRNCLSLEKLPEGILEMTSLKRLNVEECWGLKKLPNGIGRRKHVVVTLNRFPVEEAGGHEGGGCSHSNIGELGVVNVHISRGHLHICSLEEVGSRDEARTAKLEEKTSLRTLELSWKLHRNEMDDVIAATADGVLEGLRPPPSLVFLNIGDYPGQTFPSWMGDGGTAFRRLREVKLWNCKNCNQLPPLGQLPSLEYLFISGLDGVERVGREFFSGPSPTFPCLEYLTFQRMRNWSEWVALSPISSEEKEESAESPIMPVLRTLDFIDCPKLEAMPLIFTSSLRRLTVDDSSPMLYHRSFLQFLRPYETIAILGSDRWTAEFVESACICVVIGEKATELPGSLLPHHTALRRLKLADLPVLRSLPEELRQLTALQQLIIRNCPKLEAMPPIFTTSLRRLTIDYHCPMLYHRSFLQFLPLPLYETIAIVGVDLWTVVESALICVVIGTTATELPGSLLLHHTALRTLRLADLPLLRSLPEELTQLAALQQLNIRNCPELSGRYRVGGELYPKIAHIPLILIDGQDIRSA